MKELRFDDLLRSFASGLSRRATLAALTSSVFGAGSIALSDNAAARKKRKRKHKKKKKKKCKGSTKKCGKKCIPRDECCGGCAGNSLCDAGVCQPCDVTCPGGIPAACGADLQAVLEDAGEGGTVYVCPGTYQGNFALTKTMTVFGAGQGTDPASNTILDGNGTGRVLHITHDEGLVALERLRITGGGNASIGGGIFHNGTTLRLTNCTVSGNTANNAGGIYAVTDTTLEMTRCTVRGNAGGFGGGILVDGNATLTDCLVEANSAELGGGLAFIFGTATLAGSTQVRGNAAAQGGGIYVADSSLVIAETCRVTDNTAAAPGQGGGIFNSGGSVTLQGADPSPIVVNNCEENCAGDPVPKCAATPVSC